MARRCRNGATSTTMTGEPARESVASILLLSCLACTLAEVFSVFFTYYYARVVFWPALDNSRQRFSTGVWTVHSRDAPTRTSCTSHQKHPSIARQVTFACRAIYHPRPHGQHSLLVRLHCEIRVLCRDDSAKRATTLRSESSFLLTYWGKRARIYRAAK